VEFELLFFFSFLLTFSEKERKEEDRRKKRRKENLKKKKKKECVFPARLFSFFFFRSRVFLFHPEGQEPLNPPGVYAAHLLLAFAKKKKKRQQLAPTLPL
jgi:hypothetical protein